jgi:hypothetical protein
MGDVRLESMNKMLFLIAGYERSRHARMKRFGGTFSENSPNAADYSISFPRYVYWIWEVGAVTYALHVESFWTDAKFPYLCVL